MDRSRVSRVVDIVFGVVLSVAVIVATGYVRGLNNKAEGDMSVTDKVAKQVAPAADSTSVASRSDGIDPYLKRKIDFKTLLSENPDATRWMFVPHTGLDHPVMQERVVGRYFYDLRGFNRLFNGYGSFTVSAEPTDRSTGKPADDAHTVILGHRMVDYYGSADWQFSQLPIRWGSKSGGEANKYVYIYYPDHSERWRLWAASDAPGTASVYQMPYKLGADDYQQMLNYVASVSRYTIGEAPDRNTRTLMMSTCNQGNDGSWQRFFLTLVPDQAYYYATDTWLDLTDQRDEAKWRATCEDWARKQGEADEPKAQAPDEGNAK